MQSGSRLEWTNCPINKGRDYFTLISAPKGNNVTWLCKLKAKHQHSYHSLYSIQLPDFAGWPFWLMAEDQSGFHGFMKKIEVIRSVRSFMLHSCTYVEDDGIKLNTAVLWKLSVWWKEIGALTAFRASALAACCWGEIFVCDLSKILFYAVEGGR